MKKTILLLWCLLVTLCTSAQVPIDSLRNGDLIFFVNPKGNAITQVTTRQNQYPIDHVAIFNWGENHTAQVIEAVHKGVCITTLDSLLHDAAQFSTPTLLVGRVNVPFDVATTLCRAFSHLGKPYDFTFENDDEKIYCSELVQKSYVTTNGDTIFPVIALTFNTPDGTVHPYWAEYYAKRGLPVPEGIPGTSPGGQSRDPHVTILGFIEP
jgi:hypothetical protein